MAITTGAELEDRVAVASNWRLVWWRFRRHHLAMASAGLLILLYLVVLFPSFFSTQDPERTDARQAFIPLQSVPTIPIWLALSAALPRDWTPIQVFFAITVILSLVGWTTLGREVRGRFLALREEDFVLAARLAGCSRMRIILRHMVPTFVSHIIATSSLAIPVMIINETSLSFLGLGIRPPAISWGVLLQ